MKALSIQQPFAWLIANGHQDIENRDWHTRYRGFLLIHASKTYDFQSFQDDGKTLYLPYWTQRASEVVEVMPKLVKDYEIGGIVGYATLKDVVTSSGSPWFRGKYGFVLTQRHPVPFIPLRGQLYLFDVPAEIEAQINEIRDRRFHEVESKEQYQIAKEWRDYRLAGDETPPTPPSELWR
jgi:hypothetical protein